MFNDDQRSHARHVAGLPPERKCNCGWYARGDCVRCAESVLHWRGAALRSRPGEWPAGADRVGYALPDAPDAVVDYAAAAAWLRRVCVFPATPAAPGAFTATWAAAGGVLCRVCDTGAGVRVRTWTRGCGCCEENQYDCRSCDHSWWSADPDATPDHSPAGG